MDAEALLEALPGASKQIVFRRHQAATPGVQLAADLHPELAARLADLGIKTPWKHQSQALGALRSGESVVVATGTASGKSLVYQAFIAEAVLENPTSTHLLLFPTKALANDQLARLNALRIPGLRAGVYDGDTPVEERKWLRERANVLLSNPDMLHAGILGSHQKWAGFIRNLSTIVVDEAHVYRGIFGAHVALVLRRLKRVAALRSSSPVFVFASATIGNPAEHASALIGESVRAFEKDESAKPERVIAFWQPRVDEDEPTKTRSPLAETSDLLAAVAARGAKSLAFVRSRKAAELVASHASDVSKSGGKFAAYRAGYLPEERREIERKLMNGTLDGVAATTALELGIDVGGLDAVIVSGFPGSRSAFRQQIGRAGRNTSDALAIFVVDDDPLDQYFLEHPEALLDEPAESCVADVSNQTVLVDHLACAAHEAPLSRTDEQWFPDGYVEAARNGITKGLLVSQGGLLKYSGRGVPHRNFGLRGSGERVQIVEASTGRLLGDASLAQAMRSLHEGAIYLHRRETFEVQELDLDKGVAFVLQDDPPWYTQARTVSDLDVTAVTQTSRLGLAGKVFGNVRVVEQVVSYARRRIGSGELLSEHVLDLPEQTLDTTALWFTIPDELLGAASVGPIAVPGALHAAEHAAIGMMPLVVSCDRADIGGLSTALHRATNQATFFIYDGLEGGAGYAQRAFEDVSLLLGATLDRLESCACTSGCPRCVQSPKCGNGNEPLDKQAAARLVREMLSDPR